MRGRRSVSSLIFPLNQNLERTLRRLQRTLSAERLEPRRNLEREMKQNVGGGVDPPVGPPLAQPVAVEREVPLQEHFLPTTFDPPSCLVLPDLRIAHFEIKARIINMLPSYYGRDNEDPYVHLDDFRTICSTIRMENFTEDALKMRLFPFSLKDRAKYWFNSLPASSIFSWTNLQRAFLTKYFPSGKTTELRRAITSFSQIGRASCRERV